MPRVLIWSGVSTLLLIGGALYLQRGPAILLDLMAGSARLFCF
jgi:hypothetical protein